MPEIDEMVKKIVADQLCIKAERVTLQQDLREDLGADSLDFVELIMAVEDEFDIVIDDEEQEHVKCVGDLSELVGERM